MEKYKDNTGNSGISWYETGADFIKVNFKDSEKVYTYSYRSAGKHHIEKMKKLAVSGSGLGTYISQKTREKYER